MNKITKLYSDYRSFLDLKKNEKKIYLFLEKEHDISYFVTFLNDLYNKFNIKIVVLISEMKKKYDIEDLIFFKKIIYIGEGIIRMFYFKLISGRIFLTTCPDLGNSEFQRSSYPIKYFYLFHSLVSSHVIYNFGAFDNYDYILAAGPHHNKEIKKNEKIYNLKPKKILNFGYPRINELKKQYDEQSEINKKIKTILIAPTWGQWSISEICLDNIFKILTKNNYRIIYRPHPITIKQKSSYLKKINNIYKNTVEFQYNFLSTKFLKTVDILISDWSGFALEFHLLSQKNIIFIDTPAKIKNKNFNDLGIIPIEDKIRNKIGQILQIENLEKIDDIIKNLLKKGEKNKKINNLIFDYDKNKENVFNIMKKYLN